MARARPLSRERIVDEALAMAHERGVDAVTLRPLAKRLGVGASALYRHVSGRDELVSLMHGRLIDGPERKVPELPWDTGLLLMADDVWRLYATYPGLAAEALAGNASTEQSRDHAAAHVRALVTAGFPQEDAEAEVLSFVQWLMLFLTSADRLPAAKTRIHEMPDHPYAGARGIYDRGVNLLVDGMRFRLERHRG